MADEIIKKDGGLPTETAQLNVSATEGGTAVGVNYGGLHIHMEPTAEVLKAVLENYGINLLPQKNAEPEAKKEEIISHAAEWAQLSSDAFCLFVLENEAYDCGAFTISKSNALERYTAAEYQEEYKSLSPVAKDRLMTLPCIFAKRNRMYRHTDTNHPVVVGRITDIQVGTDVVRFRFDHFSVFSQEDINNNIGLFGLASCPLRNELDEEHWSIRSGDLKMALETIGVKID